MLQIEDRSDVTTAAGTLRKSHVQGSRKTSMGISMAIKEMEDFDMKTPLRASDCVENCHGGV